MGLEPLVRMQLSQMLHKAYQAYETLMSEIDITWRNPEDPEEEEEEEEERKGKEEEEEKEQEQEEKEQEEEEEELQQQQQQGRVEVDGEEGQEGEWKQPESEEEEFRAVEAGASNAALRGHRGNTTIAASISSTFAAATASASATMVSTGRTAAASLIISVVGWRSICGCAFIYADDMCSVLPFPKHTRTCGTGLLIFHVATCLAPCVMQPQECADPAVATMATGALYPAANGDEVRYGLHCQHWRACVG